jgi:hypothetical protein
MEPGKFDRFPRNTMRLPAFGPMLQKYRDFRRCNRRVVRNLNALAHTFTRVMSANLRSNEPFRVENVIHRCLKKRRLEEIGEELNRELPRDLESVRDLIQAFAKLTGEDPKPFLDREAEIRARFLDDLWFFAKVVTFNLCDDHAFLSRVRALMRHISEIKPEVATGLLAHDAGLADRITSFNEIARVLHQMGDDLFFQAVRRLHGVRTFSLGRENRLELMDLEGTESDLEAGRPLDPAKVRNPALRALLVPYVLGQHGAGREVLNVALVDGILDTQFSLGLHKAVLRAYIEEGSDSARNFVSLSYYEPPHPLSSTVIGKRLRYFSGILEALDYSIHTDSISFLSAQFKMGAESTASTLSETMRAIISLKDLDEVPGLTDDPRRVVELFRKGATNLLGLFNASRNFRYVLAGQMEKSTFAAALKGQKLNPGDLRVLFDDEFPSLVQAQGRRGKVSVPDTMRFLQDLREEIRREAAKAAPEAPPQVPAHLPPRPEEPPGVGPR